MRRRLATCVALAGPTVWHRHPRLRRPHPLNPENAKWRATADNDFNLEVAFTATYPGGAFRDRVRDVVAQDPSCSAGTCSATSYSHWYLHRAQPYFGSESAIADADPTVCPAVGQVAFYWRDEVPLGLTRRCNYAAEPTRASSATVTIDADPASAGSPAPGTWYTRGPGDDVAGGADVCAPANPRPGCVNQWDLMSVVAHEVGHVLGFGHYQESSPGGPSIDPVCLDGSTSGDPSLGDNTNRETMCSGQFRGTERQRTPEEHEKEAFANFGYLNHTTWNVPGGECGGPTTFKVGTVTLNSGTDGVIDSAADLLGNSKYPGGGWAGNFSLPPGMRTSPGSYEQAVCLVDNTGTNGNMAPLDIT